MHKQEQARKGTHPHMISRLQHCTGQKLQQQEFDSKQEFLPLGLLVPLVFLGVSFVTPLLEPGFLPLFFLLPFTSPAFLLLASPTVFSPASTLSPPIPSSSSLLKKNNTNKLLLYLLELAWALKRLLRVMFTKYRSRKVYRCRTVSRERTSESAIEISFTKLTIYCDSYTVLFIRRQQNGMFFTYEMNRRCCTIFFYRSITRVTTVLQYGIRNFLWPLMLGGLTGWLVCGLTGGFVGGLTSWLTGWFIGGLTGGLVRGLTC